MDNRVEHEKSGSEQGGVNPSMDEESVTFTKSQLDQMRHDAVIAKGAGWFYWIAGLSYITAVVVIFGGDFGFAISLGFSNLVAALGKMMSESAPSIVVPLTLTLNTVICGAFGAIGYFATRKNAPIYLLGYVLFALDTLLIIAFMDIIGIIFHGLVLFWMYPGLKAVRETAKSI